MTVYKPFWKKMCYKLTFISKSFIISEGFTFRQFLKHYRISSVYIHTARAFRILQCVADSPPDFGNGAFQFTWGLKLPHLSHIAITFVHYPSFPAFNFQFHVDKHIFAKYFSDLGGKCIFTLSGITVETRIFAAVCNVGPLADKTETKCSFQRWIWLRFLNLANVFAKVDQT